MVDGRGRRAPGRPDGPGHRSPRRRWCAASGSGEREHDGGTVGSPHLLPDDVRQHAEHHPECVGGGRVESRSPGASTARRMSCSCTHESKMRKPSSSATVPGPIGVHESAREAVVVERAELLDARRRWWRRNSSSASAPVHARRDRSSARSTSRCRSSRAGGRRARPRPGSGSPRMNRSSAVMCTRLSCTVQPGHSVGRLPRGLVERCVRARPSSATRARACRPTAGSRIRHGSLLRRRLMLARQSIRSRTRRTAWSGPFSRITSLRVARTGRMCSSRFTRLIDGPHLAGERRGLARARAGEEAEERRVVGAAASATSRAEPLRRTTPRCRRWRRRGTP